jgi:hypothetical protein
MKYIVVVLGWVFALAMALFAFAMFTVAGQATDFASLYVARGVGILLMALAAMMIFLVLAYADLRDAIQGRGSDDQSEPSVSSEEASSDSQDSTNNS